MKKKLLIIIPIVIILMILFVLYFFRFEVYTLKVTENLNNEIKAEALNEDKYYFFYYDKSIVVLGDSGLFTDISELKEGDVIKILLINNIKSHTDLLSYYNVNGQPINKIDGLKIIIVL